MYLRFQKNFSRKNFSFLYNVCWKYILTTINPRRSTFHMIAQTNAGLHVRRSCFDSHLDPHTLRLLTEDDDTRGCGDTIGPPNNEQRAARNMLRSVM